MKIFHISDTHGSGFWDHPLSPDIDVVAHTGDAFPNYTRGNVSVEARFQSEWLGKFVDKIKAWLGGRPFVYVPGNHDYIEFSDFISCHRANSEPQIIAGKVWRGFREIPWIAGEWAGELREPELAAVVDSLFADQESSLSIPDGDILLSHTPPAGVLDCAPNGFVHFGSSALSNALQYRNHNYKAVLFGHVHQPVYYQQRILGIVFSNAADNAGGVVELP